MICIIYYPSIIIEFANYFIRFSFPCIRGPGVLTNGNASRVSEEPSTLSGLRAIFYAQHSTQLTETSQKPIICNQNWTLNQKQ